MRTMHMIIKMVPQQTAIIIERLGKFHRVLSPGLNFLLPVLDFCEYEHSLKEEVYQISNQMAITKDSVTIHLDGVLYMRVTDPKKASYGVSDPVKAMVQLAQTTMRSELAKFTLDQTFEERENLNSAILKIINHAAIDWGIECMRYEIRDISPPTNIKKAMELEGEAERTKRADILDSEKKRAGEINLAEGKRQAAILRAEGEAQAVILKANSVAESIKTITIAMNLKGGGDAVRMKLVEEYVETFSSLAEVNNTVIIPSDGQGIASIIAQGMAVFDRVKQERPQQATSSAPQIVRKRKTTDDPVLASTDEATLDNTYGRLG